MLKKLFASSRIKEIQKNWTLITEKLSVLGEQYILETRAEERFRIEKLISQLKNERQQIEQELLQIDKELTSDSQDTPTWSVTPWRVSFFTVAKLRYIVLLLILGGGVWVTVDLLPDTLVQKYISAPSTQTNGKASEQRILDLEPEYERLCADFERIDSYPKVSNTVKNEAPFLAEKFLSVPENGMKSPYRLAKHQYAAYSFMVAASVDNDINKINLYTEKGIKSGKISIELVEGIVKKSIEGDMYENEVYKLIRSDYAEDKIKYNLAILYIIRYKTTKNNNDGSNAGQLLSKLTDGYKENFPVTGNKHVRWYLEQQSKEASK